MAMSWRRRSCRLGFLPQPGLLSCLILGHPLGLTQAPDTGELSVAEVREVPVVQEGVRTGAWA
eukprot:1467510-Alexandrium_andersonii.AAC.1